MKALAWLLALSLLTACAGASAASETAAPDVQAATPDAQAASIERGRALFRNKGCVTCHTNTRVEGRTGVLGSVGPDLTAYTNDPDFLRRWLANPSAVRPGARMPNLRLSAAEIEDLIVFLNETRSSTGDTHLRPETPAGPSAQPTAPPTFASSVLLAQWGASERDTKILLVDPVTGRELPGYAPIFAWPEAVSAVGTKLAATEFRGQVSEPYAGGTSYRPNAEILHLVDLPAWRAVTTTLPGKGWVWPMTFSPDATRLALAYHSRASSALLIFDADTGQLLAQQALAFRPSLMAFTPDGASLVAYGQPLGSPPGMGKPDSPRVLLAEAKTLEVMWDQPLEDIVSGDWCLEQCGEPHGAQVFAEWRPAVVLSHDGRKLYVVHADEERLTTVDLDARTIQGRGRRPSPNVGQSWFERLLALTAGVAQAKGVNTGTAKQAALSPDGRHLYVVETTRDITRSAEGNSEGIETQVGLQVIDVESGQKAVSRNIEVTGTWMSADRMRFTPDGAYLVMSGWRDGEQWTEVLHAKSLERVARLDRWDVVLTRRMDNQPIILAVANRRAGEQTELAVLDPQSFDIIHSWPAERYTSWVAAP